MIHGQNLLSPGNKSSIVRLAIVQRVMVNVERIMVNVFVPGHPGVLL